MAAGIDSFVEGEGIVRALTTLPIANAKPLLQYSVPVSQYISESVHQSLTQHAL